VSECFDGGKWAFRYNAKCWALYRVDGKIQLFRVIQHNCLLYTALHTVHSTTHCKQHYTLYTALHTVHSTAHCIQHYTLYTALHTVYSTTHCIQHYTLYTALYTVYSTVHCIQHYTALYTVNYFKFRYFYNHPYFILLLNSEFWSEIIWILILWSYSDTF
jgi:hypothetical protein